VRFESRALAIRYNESKLFQQYLPVAAPALLRSPFDDPRFVFELKQDGFCSIAYIDHSGCLLISRKGHVYRGFAPLARALGELGRPMVLDGEIVTVDAEGRSRFYDLLFHRREPVFYAFDCLSLDGRDLRGEPLTKRKRILQAAVKDASAVLFAQHLAECGQGLFSLVCERDLEGVVAKRANGTYGRDWFKIRNPSYSQYEGRRELFEQRERCPVELLSRAR